jgi:hypothetical protein
MTFKIEVTCEDADQARTFVQAMELRFAIIEAMDRLRQVRKHSDHSPETIEVLEDLGQQFRELLGDYLL